jgi:hypothetical protein
MIRKDWLITGGVIAFFVLVNGLIIWGMYSGYLSVPEGTTGNDYYCMP